MANKNHEIFKEARDRILELMLEAQPDFDFSWPNLNHFNWVEDWFGHLESLQSDALVVVGDNGVERYSFEQLISDSARLANWLRSVGFRAGDTTFIHLENSEKLFLSILAIVRLRGVLVPSYPSLPKQEVEVRLKEAGAQWVITCPEELSKFDGAAPGVQKITTGHPSGSAVSMESYRRESHIFEPDGKTDSNSPLFAYFTSGTTSRPKLVYHSNQSYPIGHLSSLFWNGVRPGDVHFNLSPPGWAKHSWSSLFVPWNAEATNVVTSVKNMSPAAALSVMRDEKVTTFCAPPTFWRALLRFGLDEKPEFLREIVSAGEPLDSRLVKTVFDHWGIRLRNGYGQTEATAIIGQAPGLEPVPGSIGRPLPGYEVVLLDLESGNPSNRGELCIDMSTRPLGMMIGYGDRPSPRPGRYYRTGDICHVDELGNYFLEGRNDNVFKSFDFRVSPYELEHVLLEVPDVAQVAVVPIDDPKGGAVPRAYVVPQKGAPSGVVLAETLFDHARTQLPLSHMIESLVFIESLPRTLTGKLNREQIRLFAEKPSGSSRIYYPKLNGNLSG
ncbi:AMP-binding protein [Marinobacter shengliensis]